jgi:polysaccharide pyruvyl transferase WcaK-like protein
MKIGILTFHCAHNYGAVLQAYALQEKLGEIGHDVEIIDYRPDYLIDPYKLPSIELKSKSPKRIIRSLLNVLLFNKRRNKRIKKFNDFIHSKLNLNFQTNIIPDNYDLYIIGSDQVWNAHITRGIDSVYWGDFLRRNDSKICTYAASLGRFKISDEDMPRISKYLENIDKISVREYDSLDQIQRLTSKEVIEVLDPTLLIDKKRWNQLAIKNTVNNKYVLIYQVRYNKYLKSIANKIAKQLKAKVIEVPAFITRNYLFNNHYNTCPSEFISLIKNAECIVTSSFHGTVFSIIYEKPFYTVVLNDGSDNRSINLLNKLTLQDRMINVNENISFSKIEYTIPNKKLKALISKSEDYINSLN